MSVYAIADLHLSLSSGKPMDVFTGWEDYIVKIESNWKSLIKQTDTVVIPGDISWAMSLEEAKCDFEFIDNLPGKKLIFKGNHDYWWNTMSKMNAFLEANAFNSIKILNNDAATADNIAICGTRGWFYDESQSEDKKVLLREAGRLNVSITQAEKTGLEPVVFLHYPPVYGNFINSEIIEVLKQHKIKRCYYGHLHGKATVNAVQGPYDGIIFRLISADFLAFRPYIIA
jgi:predicted phosphohydrolase